MSRAVFLSIVRLFVIEETWNMQPHSEILSEFYPTIERAIEEVTANEYSTKGHSFPTGLTLVQEEIARIAFHPEYGPSPASVVTSNDLSRIMAFLLMPVYEVNLVVLEFLHNFFIRLKDCSMATENVEEIVRELLRQMWNFKMEGECLTMVSSSG
jgi:hypothetical protein